MVTGPSARKDFFGDGGLDLVQGYKILMGGAPRIEDIEVDVEVDLSTTENMSDFMKRISLLFRKERIAEGESSISKLQMIHRFGMVQVLPLFVEDIHRLMSEWGIRTGGIINPFKEVYDVCMNSPFIAMNGILRRGTSSYSS